MPSKRSLRKEIAELETLLQNWVKFRNYFYPQSLTGEEEREFDAVRTSISAIQPKFVDLVEFDLDIARTMLDGLERFTHSRSAENISPTALKRIEEEWNNAYLLIQETIGLLEYRMEEKTFLKMITGRSHSKAEIPTAVDKSPMYTHIHKKKSSNVIVIIFLVIVMLIVLSVLYFMGVLDTFLSSV